LRVAAVAQQDADQANYDKKTDQSGIVADPKGWLANGEVATVLSEWSFEGDFRHRIDRTNVIAGGYPEEASLNDHAGLVGLQIANVTGSHLFATASDHDLLSGGKTGSGALVDVGAVGKRVEDGCAWQLVLLKIANGKICASSDAVFYQGFVSDVTSRPSGGDSDDGGSIDRQAACDVVSDGAHGYASLLASAYILNLGGDHIAVDDGVRSQLLPNPEKVLDALKRGGQSQSFDLGGNHGRRNHLILGSSRQLAIDRIRSGDPVCGV
jgi:hypothetical protein